MRVYNERLEQRVVANVEIPPNLSRIREIYGPASRVEGEVATNDGTIRDCVNVCLSGNCVIRIGAGGYQAYVTMKRVVRSIAGQKKGAAYQRLSKETRGRGARVSVQPFRSPLAARGECTIAGKKLINLIKCGARDRCCTPAFVPQWRVAKPYLKIMLILCYSVHISRRTLVSGATEKARGSRGI